MVRSTWSNAGAVPPRSGTNDARVETHGLKPDERAPVVWFLTHAAGMPGLGPNLRVYSMAKELSKQGFDTSVIGSGSFHKYATSPVSDRLVWSEVVDDVRMVWLRTVPYRHRRISQVVNQLHFPWRLFRCWKHLDLPSPDVIVVSSPPPFVALIAAHLARRFGVPWLFELRDLWPLVIREIASASRLNPYMALLQATERFAVRSASRMVTVKAGDADYLERRYGVGAKATYIPNGVDPDTLPRGRVSTTDVLPRTRDGAVKLVYVGSLTAYYLLDEFLYGYDLVRRRGVDVCAIIAGDGPRRAGLESIVRERRIADVHFLGRIERNAVLPLLDACDIGFVGLGGGSADRHGVSSNKLFEYMYAPIPVLACYDSVHDPVAASGGGITVKEPTAEAIAGGLERLVTMGTAQRAELAERGRAYVMKHHHLPDLARRYGDLLTMIANRGAR